MKKLLVFFVLLAGGALVFAQDVGTLDAAIKATSEAFLTNSSLEDEDVLGVLAVESDNAALSEYIIEHLTANLINAQKFIVRSREEQTQKLSGTEFERQKYGSANEDVKKAIGEQLGLTVIISGKIVPRDNVYEMTINATAFPSGRALLQFPTTIKKKDKIIAFLTRDDSWKDKLVYIGIRGGGTISKFNNSKTDKFYHDGEFESSKGFLPNAALEIAFHGVHKGKKIPVALQFEFMFTQSEMNWKNGMDWQTIETTNILAPVLIKPTFHVKNWYLSPFVGGYPKFSWGRYEFSQTTQSNSEPTGNGDVTFDVMGGGVVGGNIGYQIKHGIVVFLDVRYLIDVGRTRAKQDKIEKGSMIYGMKDGDNFYMQQMFMASLGVRWGMGGKK
jgi:hypothetical protein